MPELPEVETVRRCLAPVLEGARLVRVEVRHPRLVRRQPPGGDVPGRLRRRRVERLARRGKFLLAELEGDLVWVTHLGMSGRLQLAEPGDPEAPHTHVVVGTDGGVEVRMVDPRTFGSVSVLTSEELAESSLVALGPDALDALPPVEELVDRMAGRRVAIKTLLLDQRFLAGLGNIYADEVLHLARVRGDRPAGSLVLREVGAIRSAIPRVLEAGLRFGGTSLEDLSYLLPDGRTGEYLDRLAVYGREGFPCRRCGAAIRRVVLGARSSFWCPECQR